MQFDFDWDEALKRLRTHLNDHLRGKSETVELVLACLLARGNLLIEDLPGLGKTTLAKALAGAIGGKFSRIQCTPDLLPGDVTGFNIFNQQTSQFEFHEGPVFADVVLADEINRSTPRTQSALLEAMAEHQVTIDNLTYRLSDTFFVIATQNPEELHGTFPLPEAQLDRFSMKISIGAPDRASLIELMKSRGGVIEGFQETTEAILSRPQLLQLQQRAAAVETSDTLLQYVANLSETLLGQPTFTGHLSPRGVLQWLRCGQAWAFLQQRDFVTADDIQKMAVPVVAARTIGPTLQGREQILDLISRVKAPF
ncbi:AAA family ATPase [Blastopirellula retiformator]|uniref:ATPase family associated with various cellular activities (AAA) n=1 Tax=Blastopirellula retiformator TaxID=2527970 RepID=A0A5C5UZK6_9BACT|nr:MoxR family ATPase [Blastopirellula retiformator]TWT31806.1 ATPase family associated with various cellular activities (AAA) [Blastopirellula retiformator]